MKPAGSVGAAEIVTLEGLGSPAKPHPIQKAFIDEGAAQCGYCLSGVILTAKSVLDANPRAANPHRPQRRALPLLRQQPHDARYPEVCP